MLLLSLGGVASTTTDRTGPPRRMKVLKIKRDEKLKSEKFGERELKQRLRLRASSSLRL